MSLRCCTCCSSASSRIASRIGRSKLDRLRPSSPSNVLNLESRSVLPSIDRYYIPGRQARFFHSTVSPTSAASSSSSSPSPSSQQQLKDEQIKSRYVRLVTEKGLSSQPARTKDVLREMDRSQFWLVQVKAGSDSVGKATVGDEEDAHDENDSETEGGKGRVRKKYDQADKDDLVDSSSPSRPILENLPLVKFVSKKEAYDKAKAIKQQKKSSNYDSHLSKSSSSPPKLIQLTWAVSPNDLSHKLKNARKDLINKGNKVRVEVITKKGGGKSVAGGEMERKKLEFMKKVEDVICEELKIRDQEDVEKGEETAEGVEIAKIKEVRRGKRAGEIEWRNNGAIARCTFELVRSKS